ncbi:hypothetical protein [Marinibactrum halimedae]|uniref:Uncharacterized protein n=1 Tax=Marinibactrum halimedae TaxID=1444977 RepID=A0AA37T5W4_9GAMM|nr:hypothetical protein [Marinibactrum halimedae]MCD9458473.1 hypothetical protein [Marinibactrum halimedae]GLS26169.1 hypothetical protein GCM10007877_18840 [Marinibactrum halimedae]
MKHEEKLKREDSLASWRLATLLTFNGFLITAITRLKPEAYAYIIKWVPAVGILVSLSVLAVSLLSANVKWKLHISWPKDEGDSPITEKFQSEKLYYIYNFLGPYILSPLVLSFFWLVFIFEHC